MQFIDYYETLGVARDASQDDVRRAFRKLARKFHPDVNKDPDAAERFKRVNEANAVLSDPEKRGKYDRYGQAWQSVREGQQPPPDFAGMPFDLGQGGEAVFEFGPSGASSFFEALFGAAAAPGGPRHGRHRRAWRGHDAEAQLPLTLEEAAHGCKRHLQMQDHVTGALRTVEVTVPPGVLPGKRIRLSGQGGPGHGGGQAGDLFLAVDVLPHRTLRLDGVDLHAKLDVTPWDAALGGEARLETLDGAVSVKIPAGSSSGRKVRLRGKGFPGPGAQPGDLYAEIRIVLPESLTPEEAELFGRLREASDFTPQGRRTREAT